MTILEQQLNTLISVIDNKGILLRYISNQFFEYWSSVKKLSIRLYFMNKTPCALVNIQLVEFLTISLARGHPTKSWPVKVITYIDACQMILHSHAELQLQLFITPPLMVGHAWLISYHHFTLITYPIPNNNDGLAHFWSQKFPRTHVTLQRPQTNVITYIQKYIYKLANPVQIYNT